MDQHLRRASAIAERKASYSPRVPERTDASSSKSNRSGGTYGGRERRMLSSKKANARVTTPAVNTFLGTLNGTGTGDSTDLVKKEAEEVSALRKEYDNTREARKKKERLFHELENQLAELKNASKSHKEDYTSASTSASKVESQSREIEMRLEEEHHSVAIFKHMISRLTSEVQVAASHSRTKESRIKNLRAVLAQNTASLLAARQDKAASERQMTLIKRDSEATDRMHGRALAELDSALSATKKKFQILERREQSRRDVMAQAMGELSVKQSKKLQHESQVRRERFAEVMSGIQSAEERLVTFDATFRRLSEAAGSAELKDIVHKYVSRGATFAALQQEYADSETRMRKLREKHKSLTDTLDSLRETQMTNNRGVYQEMDETADKLKELEKDALVVSEKSNRANVILDSCRSCMMKSLGHMENVHGLMEYGSSSSSLDKNELSTLDLIQFVDQKLSRVVDTINREKAELELHRVEVSQGLRTSSAAGNVKEIIDEQFKNRQPDESETEEHFILRVSKVDTSADNVRVGPSKTAAASTAEDEVSVSGNHSTTTTHDNTDFEDSGTTVVIDRHTRKKLANLVISNRGKKNKN